MADPSIRWNPEVSFGAILQIITVIVTVGGVYGYISGSLHEGELARAKYIPIVEALQKSDNVQEERIANLALAIIELRRNIDMIRDQLQTISIQLTDIKARLPPERQGMLGPGGRTVVRPGIPPQLGDQP